MVADEFIRKFKSILQGENKNLIVVCILAGFCLILTANFLPKKTKTSKTQPFECKYEQKLEKIISKIDGAGKAKIFISYETAGEVIYATEDKENTETIKDRNGNETVKEMDKAEKRYITFKDSNGKEEPLELKRILPKPKSAVIVCKGSSNKLVRAKISNAVTVALGIPPEKVSII
ncbi:MAG: hypothetical protein LBP36_04065 [Oscillospiraceae bacterium]|jgi:stage III sporulation protein AG|nr:hypothetical protein [Oscillospiraceae bacterium]